MQNYISCDIQVSSDLMDILVAEMGDLGFEGFIENENGFEAYLPAADFKEQDLIALLENYNLPSAALQIKVVAPQNWNADWERNFEPVCIDTTLRIRAPFHAPDPAFPLELLIQPKTSFGTGHHETTYTIMRLMLEMEMQGKTVFDYGSGTGILAILAMKLGAQEVFANDIDLWAAENIYENMALNAVDGISFLQGDLSVAPAGPYDIILANINKNILLSSFEGLRPLLKEAGCLFISGFYDTDLTDLLAVAKKQGFKLVKQVSKNNWTAAEFTI